MLIKAEKRILSGEIAPAYFIYGDETYWHDRFIQILSETFTDGAEYLSGDDTTLQQLNELLTQISFFGPKLWVVRGASELFDQKSNQPETNIYAIAPGNCLLLSSVTKTNPAPRSFIRFIRKLGGEVLKATEPSWRDASIWIRESLTADGYTITRNAQENLILIAGRSLKRLGQEIEKLKLFIHPQTRITAEHVADCVSPDPEMNTFAFVDAVANKNLGKAFSEVEDLKVHGVNPIFMIAVLGSHFGLMWRTKEAVQSGVNQSSLGTSLGVHPYAAKKAFEQSKRWSFSQMEKALRLLCHVDESLKTGNMDIASSMDYVLVRLITD